MPYRLDSLAARAGSPEKPGSNDRTLPTLRDLCSTFSILFFIDGQFAYTPIDVRNKKMVRVVFQTIGVCLTSKAISESEYYSTWARAKSIRPRLHHRAHGKLARWETFYIY